MVKTTTKQRGGTGRNIRGDTEMTVIVKGGGDTAQGVDPMIENAAINIGTAHDLMTDGEMASESATNVGTDHEAASTDAVMDKLVLGMNVIWRRKDCIHAHARENDAATVIREVGHHIKLRGERIEVPLAHFYNATKRSSRLHDYLYGQIAAPLRTSLNST